MEFWSGAIIGLVLNFISLYLPAKRKVRKLTFNPAIVIGNFILVPVYFGLATIFLQNNWSKIDWMLLLLAVPAVFIYGKQFKLIKKVWFLHGLVAIWPIWFASLLLINQLLGIIYPKKI